MKHAKHPNFWSTSSMRFNEAHQACHFMKHAKHVNFLKHINTSNTRVHQAHEARDHVKHTSTVSTWSRQARKARKVREHASMSSSRLFYFATKQTTHRSSCSRMFSKIDVLKNFTNFTRKHLRWSHFLIKLQALYDSNTGVFVWSLNF